jgi:hypothetical protein
MVKIGKSGKERYYFDLFGLQVSLPPGQISYGDKPDVIIEGDKIIGIEVTNFYLEDGANPASEQVQRALRADVLATAEGIYRGDGGTVGVTLEFNKAIPIKTSRKEKSALARRISEVIRTLSRTETGGEVYRHKYQNAVPELGFLHFHSPPYDDGKWRTQQSYEGG